MSPARIRLLLFTLSFSFLLGSTRPGFAQETYDRRVIGQVVGTRGEAIVGATVTLKNVNQGTMERSDSDSDGGFLFANLSTAATYELFAEYDGKRSQVESFTPDDDGNKIDRATLAVPLGVPAAQESESHERVRLDEVLDGIGDKISGALTVLKEAGAAISASVSSDRDGNFQFTQSSAGYEIRAQNGAAGAEIRIVDKTKHDEKVELSLKFSR